MVRLWQEVAEDTDEEEDGDVQWHMVRRLAAEIETQEQIMDGAAQDQRERSSSKTGGEPGTGIDGASGGDKTAATTATSMVWAVRLKEHFIDKVISHTTQTQADLALDMRLVWVHNNCVRLLHCLKDHASPALVGLVRTSVSE